MPAAFYYSRLKAILGKTENHFTYVITSGWWSAGSDKADTRVKKIGDESTRQVGFHNLWNISILRFTNPKKVLVVDSASPSLPKVQTDWISLDKNYGHASRCDTKFSGFTRSHLLGMWYAYACDADYWVFVEQDVLLFGEGIIEHAISRMKKPVMFGSARGIPQPLQQSLVIIRKDYIPIFSNALASIQASDKDVDPEKKYAIASSWFLRCIPSWFYRLLGRKGPVGLIVNGICYLLFSIFKGYDTLPFGYGRKRPIDFTEKFFYFQHASAEELEKYHALCDAKSHPAILASLT